MKKNVLMLGVLLTGISFVYAEPIKWDVESGDWTVAANWDSNAVPGSADDAIIDNGGTAIISGGSETAAAVRIGENKNTSGTLNVDGGSLTAQLYVASRASGVINVGTSATLNATGISYIGLYGDDYLPGKGFAGNGTVNVFGTMSGAEIRMAQNGATGELNVDGGSLTLVDLRMSNNTQYTNRSAKLSIVGSDCNVSIDDVLAADETASFDFIADENGFSTLHASDRIAIHNAVLNINLDAYSGGPTNFVLMNSADVWNGVFSSTNFLGSKTGTLVYDTDNGDLVLEVIPEPATIMILTVGGFVFFVRRRLFRSHR